jgi:hypothetical protein
MDPSDDAVRGQIFLPRHGALVDTERQGGVE